ncbi:MAG: proteophosphoglycan ppg1 [Elusimicrobia bacterium]|nr:MAG: proteophosphoglycan ppg1 [Elusimicrobiota bacterium]
MKTSEEKRGAVGGVDLVALWETGEGLGGAPVFKGKAKPGANRWVRRAGGLSMNWAAITAGLMVLVLVPFMAQEGSRPPVLDEGSSLDGVLGVDPFVAEAGAGAMSPGHPSSDGFDAPRSQDPSLMVLGPEGPAVVTAASPASAPTAPASKPAGPTDWATALKNAVRTAAPAAVKKAGLPSPSARLAGALKAIMGGAGSSASKSSSEAPRLSAPSSKDLLSSFKAMDSLQLRRSEPLMRSLAKGGPTISGAQGGATFPTSSRPTGGSSASENLRDAVAAFGSPSSNGQGGGGPAVFDGGKGPGANPAGVAKAPGESLEFQRRKMEMEKEMDLKYAKRKYNELGRQEMLDKVNAESAAKMKETVAGKMIDGAFGLAQKAIGGEGGGKGGGGDESAVAAKERADAENRKLGQSAQGTGEGGRSLGEQFRQAAQTKDKVIATDVAPPLGSGAGKMTTAGQGQNTAKATLDQASSSLGMAHDAIRGANQASELQEQGNKAFTQAAQTYIQALNIQAPPPPPPGGQALNVPADAQGPLSKANAGRQKAEASIGQASQLAATLPQDLGNESGKLTQVINQRVGRGHASTYGAFNQTVGELGKHEATLQVGNRQASASIESYGETSAKTAMAQQSAEAAFKEAANLKTELQIFDMQMQSQSEMLREIAKAYKLVQFNPNPLAQAEARKLEGAFESIKGGLQSNLQSKAQKIPAVDQKIQEAKKKLGGS